MEEKMPQGFKSSPTFDQTEITPGERAGTTVTTMTTAMMTTITTLTTTLKKDDKDVDKNEDVDDRQL